jgi:hypothetical protein
VSALDVFAWLLEHPTLTLTVCAVLVVDALVVLLVRGRTRADRMGLGERGAVQR